MATYTMYEVGKLGLRKFKVSNDHMHQGVDLGLAERVGLNPVVYL